VNQLTKVMALALAPHGIRVNAIGPGSIMTDMLASVASDKAARDRVLSRTPLGRIGDPSEIAAIAAFLASDEASYITGQTIYADGGRLPLNYTVPVREDSLDVTHCGCPSPSAHKPPGRLTLVAPASQLSSPFTNTIWTPSEGRLGPRRSPSMTVAGRRRRGRQNSPRPAGPGLPAETSRPHACHLVDSRLQRKEPELAGVMAEHAGEGPQSRGCGWSSCGSPSEPIIVKGKLKTRRRLPRPSGNRWRRAGRASRRLVDVDAPFPAMSERSRPVASGCGRDQVIMMRYRP
jgi:hypothetical protein